MSPSVAIYPVDGAGAVQQITSKRTWSLNVNTTGVTSVLITLQITSGGPAPGGSDNQSYFSFSNFRTLSQGANYLCPISPVSTYSATYGDSNMNQMIAKFVLSNSSMF